MDLGREALLILPEEIWEHIFSNMITPNGVHIKTDESKPICDIAGSDLLSCSRVCKDFERVLRKTETIWLFKEVFPLLMSYLPLNDILKCRIICKEWSRTVDKFVWDMTHECTGDEIPGIRTKWTGSEKLVQHLELQSYYLNHWGELDEMGKFFSSTHGATRQNPFIHRTLYLRSSPTSEIQRSTPPFLPAILGQFGEHLVHFGISPGMVTPLLNFLDDITLCLEALPNLKSLEIFGAPYWYDRNANMDEDLDMMMRPLVRYSERWRLPQLKYLVLDSLKDKSFLIQSQLASMYAVQLSRLHLRVSSNDWSISVPSVLPNLKELYLAIESLKMAEILVSRLLKSQCPPRLITMGLSLCSSKFVSLKGGRTIDQFFQLFNLFGATLQTLKIEADDDFEKDTPPKSFTVRRELTCPALKCVEIEGFSGLSLNFLLNFKDTLEHVLMDITVEDTPRALAYSNEIVDVYNYVDNGKLYRSNVWEVLPNLQFLQLDYEHLAKRLGGRFSRKTYKELQSRRLK